MQHPMTVGADRTQVSNWVGPAWAGVIAERREMVYLDSPVSEIAVGPSVVEAANVARRTVVVYALLPSGWIPLIRASRDLDAGREPRQVQTARIASSRHRSGTGRRRPQRMCGRFQLRPLRSPLCLEHGGHFQARSRAFAFNWTVLQTPRIGRTLPPPTATLFLHSRAHELIVRDHRCAKRFFDS
jgi:hypothetical protein